MYKRGYLSGEQLKKKGTAQSPSWMRDSKRRAGYNVLLGGNCNMMRSPQAGRNFENYGPEPSVFYFLDDYCQAHSASVT